MMNVRIFYRKRYRLVGFMLMLFLVKGCSSDFLGVKPDKSLLIPSALNDYEALINNEFVNVLNTPSLGILGTDNVYLTDDMLKGTGLTKIEKNVYVWEPDLFEDAKYIGDWKNPYESIFYSNVVIEGLDEIERNGENELQWERVWGTALFYRALGHFNLVRNFADVYDENAQKKMGIPMKLTASISDLSGRADLKTVYDRIVSDLLLSLAHVPEVNLRKSLPDRNAVNALLARVYIVMNEFEQAYEYADKVLQKTDVLLDYNTLNLSAAKPIPSPYPDNANPEVVFFSQMASWSFRSIVYVSPELYNLYDGSDLRKQVFFAEQDNGHHSFVGTYNRRVSLFDGITTAELYLIRAECAARRRDYDQARRDLALLWKHRYHENAAPDPNRIEDESILAEVLKERRKELAFRNLRWSDLKRLNKDPRTETYLSRQVEGKEIELVPNSPRYIFPIPKAMELDYNDMEQNER
ncbi:RagB/SusD family nutrient uptake outer membrane protein [Sphingobacterium corticibacterium]|uniref:RagB/SusD family nutrient uptake outer membrane protein n=1 Tax=Sphingobacterium corticibacterium TaxID=2484746 RepID=A0A4Q6XQU5_9SPHI|nr:RagB/SusD family nutrient uptake outer membrane protein [Sphingobacterium corticibacterium]RZF58576.1 RagB/SusD family nutrient uptake outer membrane protein [Sphingobacterium corticibacterium]